MNEILPILTREESMRVLREGNVPDALIGAAFGISGQRVNAILGPHAKLGKRDPTEPPADFPAYLRNWRDRNRISQAAAARAVGVTTNTWAHWEQGVGCSLPATVALCLSLIEERSISEREKKPGKRK